VIVPDEELEVKIDGFLHGENIAQLLNPVLKLLLLCNIIYGIKQSTHVQIRITFLGSHGSRIRTGKSDLDPGGNKIINSYIKLTLSLKKCIFTYVLRRCTYVMYRNLLLYGIHPSKFFMLKFYFHTDKRI
jgi:hypothetical protein